MTPPAAVVVSFPDNVLPVAAGIIVLLAFVVFARLLGGFVVDALRRRQMHSGTAGLAGRVLTIALIALGAVLALAIAVQSQNVAFAGIVLATIVASFGVQDLLKDYVSGYYVLLERHIKVGDHIAVDSWSGSVVEIRLRVTLLRSDDGDQVVVPNSVLFNQPVTIHTPPAPDSGST